MTEQRPGWGAAEAAAPSLVESRSAEDIKQQLKPQIQTLAGLSTVIWVGLLLLC